MRRVVSFGPPLVVLVSAALLLAVVPSLIRRIDAARTSGVIQVARRELDEDPVLERLNHAIQNVARVVEPSTVHIAVRGRKNEHMLFGSSGSGWVYDELGHIVTNQHVVFGGETIDVQFADGQVRQARLIGADLLTDIAVLKVDPGPGVFALPRATDQLLGQGDRVFAFGSPFGFKFSMSEGIVSGLGRNARGAISFAGSTNYIQTDAAINPGNSGGPLVDIRARLVGMNVAIATSRDSQGTPNTEGQSSGISFAIPLATIEGRVKALIETGRPPQAMLGVRQTGDGFTRATDETDTPGLRVEVPQGGPADQAGMKSGDRILALDDVPIYDWETFSGIIAWSSPGQRMSVRVDRGGIELELKVTLGTLPADRAVDRTRAAISVRTGLRLDAAANGALISRAFEGYPAYEAGFRRGQIILEIDGTPVSNALEAIDALQTPKLFLGQPIPIKVRDQTAPPQSPPIELTLRLKV